MALPSAESGLSLRDGKATAFFDRWNESREEPKKIPQTTDLEIYPQM
jgi:hypothetical protein